MDTQDNRFLRERKRRNYAIAAALVCLVALFYLMTLVRVHW